MIIVNAKLDGEYTYDITVGTNSIYRVFAYDAETALNVLADYMESHKHTNSYLDNETAKLISKCSGYWTVEEFEVANKLTRCGTHNIYIPITSIKGGM